MLGEGEFHVRVGNLAFFKPNFGNLAFFPGCWLQNLSLAFWHIFGFFLRELILCPHFGMDVGIIFCKISSWKVVTVD